MTGNEPDGELDWSELLDELNAAEQLGPDAEAVEDLDLNESDDWVFEP